MPSFVAISAISASLTLALGADLSIPVQSAGPGDSLIISAVFAPGSDLIGGLQFDLEYDGSVTLISVPGAASRDASKTVYYADLNANSRRFVIGGINQNPIPSGSVVDLFINLVPGAGSGLHPLSLLNFIATDLSGNVVSTTMTSGGVNVQSTVGSRTQPSEVLNAASFLSGPIAAGEIITIIGSGIGPTIAQQPAPSVTNTALGGVTVLFDGIMAPLLYAGPNQINAIVPFEVSGESVTNVLVENSGELIAGFPLSVAGAAPAIFTLDASGAGPGAVLNQDLTLNSALNPADRGAMIVFYATGAGSMNPQPPDGQVTTEPSYPNLPVSVTIGGLAANVLYSGVAPGEVAGLIQINCVVPQDTLPGDSVSVSLMVGAASSPPGVVIAVR